jgi:hypothetical protein
MTSASVPSRSPPVLHRWEPGLETTRESRYRRPKKLLPNPTQQVSLASAGA